MLRCYYVQVTQRSAKTKVHVEYKQGTNATVESCKLSPKLSVTSHLRPAVCTETHYPQLSQVCSDGLNCAWKKTPVLCDHRDCAVFLIHMAIKFDFNSQD